MTDANSLTYRGRIMWRGYASILRLLRDEVLTAGELAKRIDAHPNVMRQMVRRMRVLGLVHIVEWRRAWRAPAVAAFAAGQGEDAPPPPTTRGTVSRHQGAVGRPIHPTPELTAFANIWRTLQEGATVPDTAAATGCGEHNLRLLIRHMRAIGLVYVAGWDRGATNRPLAEYKIGQGPDVPKPKPVPRRIVAARSLQRRRQRRAQLRVLHALAANAGQLAFCAEHGVTAGSEA